MPYAEKFYRVAFFILKDKDDAKDAVQDLYVKLWNSRDKLGGVSKPLSYGILMMRNLCLDRLRKGKNYAMEQLDDGSELVSEAVMPDQKIIRRDTFKDIERLVQELPEKQRKVVELRYFHEMEYDEISRVTGMSEINCRVLLSLAKKTLKRKIRYEE